MGLLSPSKNSSSSTNKIPFTVLLTLM